MNNKYQRYINYIVNDIEKPYLKSLEQYGLKNNEYELVLSKVFNQPLTIKDNYVFDSNGKIIYSEDSTGYWYKKEYDNQGNLIYSEDSTGYWEKYEYDNTIYFENSDGYWRKWEYDINGNIIYSENSTGYIRDDR